MFNGISNGFPARDEIFPEMQHNQAKFSGIWFLHGTAATTSTSQPTLSPTTVTTTTFTTTTTDESFIFTPSTFILLREVLHESFIFTSSTFNFWGKSRTKASFSRLPRSIFEGSLARKLHFHIFHFQFQQLIQETSEPCHVLRLLAALGGATRAKNNSFSASNGPRLADRDYVIFWLSFRYRSGYRLGHLVWSRKSAKQWFWETLLLKFLNAAWTKPEAAAKNEKHKLQKE